MPRLIVTLVTGAVFLVACQDQSAKTDSITNQAANGVAVKSQTTPPNTPNGKSSEPENENATMRSDRDSNATIPAAFHGRWGMNGNDCTSTRGDAKGLITISADRIDFYESRATPVKVTGSYAENFTAEFAFTGEGQSWTKLENLKLTNSSKTMVRTDKDGSFSYQRCA
ncbi:hypothetical protein [Rhizorhapis sp. SPR117]|uniref:hypothetical protein n=1 Tax=Rhizorhapis sp. SPR117 TaxID=2912611 RepID=UPI001F473590|nr:hypothetical protein [Rhizorhapis sp. SPR117]